MTWPGTLAGFPGCAQITLPTACSLQSIVLRADFAVAYAAGVVAGLTTPPPQVGRPQRSCSCGRCSPSVPRDPAFPSSCMSDGSRTYGFIGAGRMARALARGFQRSGIAVGRIGVYDPVDAAAAEFVQEIDGAQRLNSNGEVVQLADVVFLAVKPQNLAAVSAELAGTIDASCLVVSILAGVALQRLATQLGTDRVVRVMPNTPCLVGAGASAYALGEGATEADAAEVDRLLSCVGICLQLEERHLDAVTGLSGSGPAYVYTVIESLSDGGVRMGLPRAAATALAAQTVMGAARMVLATGDHPAVLRDQVTSPGGTTAAGLQALEERGVRAAVIGAVQAATDRSRELGSS